MTSPDTPPSLSATPGAARPSLTGVRGAESEKLSILASVESPEREVFAPARLRIRWPWIAFGALCVGVGAVYVWQPMGDPSSMQSAATTGVSASPAVTNSSVAVMRAASEPLDAEAMRIMALLSEPARVETMEVPQATASDDPFVTLGAAASAGSLAAAPAAPSASAVRAVETAPTKPAAKSTENKRKPRVAGASASKPTVRRVAAKKSAPNKDPDAELLAALMAHMGSEGATAGATATRKPAKAVDQPTIAKLVKRCESLKGGEAAQCRQRICDGYWGKAQACPAPLAEAAK